MKIKIILLCLLCSGCTRVTQEEWNAVANACDDRGGISFYSNPFSLNDKMIGEVICIDGTVITVPPLYKIR